MDANKLKVLQSLPYKIQKCCGLCSHGQLSANGWGTCKVNDYEHLKHSDSNRKMSIMEYGYCPKFELKKNLQFVLCGFEEFLDSK